MIRHRQKADGAASGSILPISSPEAGLHHHVGGDASKASISARKGSLGTRRRKIRSKRHGGSGCSCCVYLCLVPLLLVGALVLYAKLQPPHKQQEGGASSRILDVYSKMKPYLSSSSTTTLRQLLEKDAELDRIFAAAKPVETTINFQKVSVYMVFLTVRDASSSTTTSTSSSSAHHSPYKVFQGHSTSSARDALHQALSHTGVLPILAMSKWIYLEFVDSVAVLHNWNYQETIPHEPDWWYGLAVPHLGENSSFVFPPAELFTHALVDARGYLRWDHVWNLVETKGRQGGRKHYVSLDHLGVTTDDTSILPHAEIFTTQAYFGEVLASPVSHALSVSWAPLVHGHRSYADNEHLLHNVEVAMSNAFHYWLGNVVRDDGSMVYAYHPRSNLVKEPIEEFLDYHYMTRHVGTLFATSRWLSSQHQKQQLTESEEAIVELVHAAVEKGLDYVLSKALRKDCPIPLNPEIKSRCMCQAKSAEHVTTITTRLDLNALTLLALTEYVNVLTSAKKGTRDQVEQQIEVYWKAAKDLSIWIAGAQHENGSLVQKVMLEPAWELDQAYYVHYYPGLAAFAMARLYTVTNHLRSKATDVETAADREEWQVHHPVHKKLLAILPSEDNQQAWFEVAAKTAQYVVAEEQGKNHEDAEFVIDHWLLRALGELQFTMKQLNKEPPSSLQDYVHHSIQVLKKFQTASATLDHEKGHKDLDRAGIFYDDLSSAATALKLNGLCAVYDFVADENRKSIAEMVESGVRYLMQSQVGPEWAMFLRQPWSVLGGFRESITTTELRVDYVQYNLESLLCLERILNEQTKK